MTSVEVNNIIFNNGRIQTCNVTVNANSFSVSYQNNNYVVSSGNSNVSKASVPTSNSATPTSATPNSATPNSATPTSATPTSATPTSTTPNAGNVTSDGIGNRANAIQSVLKRARTSKN